MFSPGTSACMALTLLSFSAPSLAAEPTDQAAREFIREYELTVKPLQTASGLAWWNANTTGRDEDFAEKEALENKLNEVLSSKEQFERLEKINEGEISDPQLARQIELLYLTYKEKQVDLSLLKRISSKETSIEKTFNSFRATIGDDTYTDSQVREILRESKESEKRQQIWQAAKQVGQKVAADLRELVDYRNRAARQLGYADFHAMKLELNEQSQDEVLQLFDELDELTREPFARVKQEIDEALAEQYGIEVEALQSWHYHDPFFQ